MTNHRISSNFQDVARFHSHFGQAGPVLPQLLTSEVFQFRKAFLDEELREFATAHTKMDLAAAADALIDLTYVVMGTAVLMGLPWQPLWEAVHAANMRKIRCTDPKDSQRNSTLDIIKPINWTPPNIRAILADCGWRDGDNGD